jgi:hypothetical protein
METSDLDLWLHLRGGKDVTTSRELSGKRKYSWTDGPSLNSVQQSLGEHWQVADANSAAGVHVLAHTGGLERDISLCRSISPRAAVLTALRHGGAWLDRTDTHTLRRLNATTDIPPGGPGPATAAEDVAVALVLDALGDQAPTISTVGAAITSAGGLDVLRETGALATRTEENP